MCLAQGHNTVTPVRLESTTPWSQDKHSAIEPLPSLILSAFNWFTQDKYLHMTAWEISDLDVKHQTQTKTKQIKTILNN